ncbi:MAG: iron-sulfur cluster assembly protein, partial [Acidovorax sp.]
MAVTEQGLLAALSSVLDPHTAKDFVSTRALRNVQIHGGDVAFEVELGYPAKSIVPDLRRHLVTAAKGVPGVENVSVNITTKVVAHAVQRGVQLLPQVK